MQNRSDSSNQTNNNIPPPPQIQPPTPPPLTPDWSMITQQEESNYVQVTKKSKSGGRSFLDEINELGSDITKTLRKTKRNKKGRDSQQ